MTEDDAAQWFRRGQAAEAAGAAGDAEAAYGEALARAPSFLEAHHNLAGVLRRSGRAAEALPHAETAARLAPDNSTVRHALALTLEAAGRVDEALEAFHATVMADPDNGGAANNLGRVLLAAGRNQAAVAALEEAAARFPNMAAIHANLAGARLAVGDPAGAVASANRALEMEPGLAAALNARGAAREVQGDSGAAISDFRAAIEAAPDFAEAHENLALALLRVGQFEAGWREYEWRWRNSANQLTPMPYASPAWDGTPLAGRTLLLHAEQGLGDAIQFVRFAARVAKNGGHIIAACPAALRCLFAGVTGIDQVCAQGEEPAGVDCHAALMSLPRLTRTDPKEYGTGVPYIEAGESSLPGLDLDPGALNIGVAWAGRGTYGEDSYRNRDCGPEHFRRLAGLPGVRLVSLHRGPCPSELLDAGRLCRDFADDAAVLARLDMVISVDTALAHLAGAMNRPTWILLPKSADWRWMEASETTIWYPSARLFRQSESGDWNGLFAGVERAVQAERGQ